MEEPAYARPTSVRPMEDITSPEVPRRRAVKHCTPMKGSKSNTKSSWPQKIFLRHLCYGVSAGHKSHRSLNTFAIFWQLHNSIVINSLCD